MWYYDGRIRIKPDWNVKLFNLFFCPVSLLIRIKPDWNVKDVYIIQRGGWASLE